MKTYETASKTHRILLSISLTFPNSILVYLFIQVSLINSCNFNNSLSMTVSILLTMLIIFGKISLYYFYKKIKYSVIAIAILNLILVILLLYSGGLFFGTPLLLKSLIIDTITFLFKVTNKDIEEKRKGILKILYIVSVVFLYIYLIVCIIIGIAILVSFLLY